jgi:hypothetical protein
MSSYMDSRLARLRAAAHSISRERVTLEVSRAFDEAGVEHAMLKGAVFAHWLYENPNDRSYGDSDVLINPEHLETAEAALQQLGFERYWTIDIPDRKPRVEWDWIRRADSARVDLHVTMQCTPRSPGEVWAILSERRRRVDIAGQELVALDDVANALHVVLHAARHGKDVAKPLVDLDRVLHKMSRSTWTAVVRLAEELDSSEWLSSGLRLSREGETLADDLGLPVPRSPEVLAALDSPPVITGTLTWLEGLGWRSRLRYLVRTLFPPPDSMRTVSPMAQRGFVGLVAAYPWRWWWLARRLPAAARAWRRRRGLGNLG